MAWKFNGILSAFIANSSDALLHDTTSKCQIDNQMFVCEVKFVSIISCSNVITGQCTHNQIWKAVTDRFNEKVF